MKQRYKIFIYLFFFLFSLAFILPFLLLIGISFSYGGGCRPFRLLHHPPYFLHRGV